MKFNQAYHEVYGCSNSKWACFASILQCFHLGSYGVTFIMGVAIMMQILCSIYPAIHQSHSMNHDSTVHMKTLIALLGNVMSYWTICKFNIADTNLKLRIYYVRIHCNSKHMYWDEILTIWHFLLNSSNQLFQNDGFKLSTAWYHLNSCMTPTAQELLLSSSLSHWLQPSHCLDPSISRNFEFSVFVLDYI